MKFIMDNNENTQLKMENCKLKNKNLELEIRNENLLNIINELKNKYYLDDKVNELIKKTFNKIENIYDYEMEIIEKTFNDLKNIINENDTNKNDTNKNDTIKKLLINSKFEKNIFNGKITQILINIKNTLILNKNFKYNFNIFFSKECIYLDNKFDDYFSCICKVILKKLICSISKNIQEIIDNYINELTELYK
jgi:hypothetical protein